MEIKMADFKDIDDVTDLRMYYLKETYSRLSTYNENKIRENNITYLKRQLNNNCFIAFVKENGRICSCAYLNIIEKVANLRFMNGLYGEIYGVFTLREYRKQGMATKLIKLLVEKGKELQLSFIKLDASIDGYELYKKVGFQEFNSEYREMKYLYVETE